MTGQMIPLKKIHFIIKKRFPWIRYDLLSYKVIFSLNAIELMIWQNYFSHLKFEYWLDMINV